MVHLSLGKRCPIHFLDVHAEWDRPKLLDVLGCLESPQLSLMLIGRQITSFHGPLQLFLSLGVFLLEELGFEVLDVEVALLKHLF